MGPRDMAEIVMLVFLRSVLSCLGVAEFEFSQETNAVMCCVVIVCMFPSFRGDCSNLYLCIIEL